MSAPSIKDIAQLALNVHKRQAAQSEQIDSLRSENEALRSRLEKLEGKLQNLYAIVTSISKEQGSHNILEDYNTREARSFARANGFTEKSTDKIFSDMQTRKPRAPNAKSYDSFTSFALAGDDSYDFGDSLDDLDHRLRMGRMG